MALNPYLMKGTKKDNPVSGHRDGPSRYFPKPSRVDCARCTKRWRIPRIIAIGGANKLLGGHEKWVLAYDANRGTGGHKDWVFPTPVAPFEGQKPSYPTGVDKMPAKNYS